MARGVCVASGHFVCKLRANFPYAGDELPLRTCLPAFWHRVDRARQSRHGALRLCNNAV